MTVETIEGHYRVLTDDELESVMMKRFRDGMNFFWMYHAHTKIPALAIAVKDDIAYLSYMPGEREAGFQSVGHPADLEWDDTSFILSETGEEIEVQNQWVVPFSSALAAAKEFLISDQLPESVEWSEL